MLRLAGMLRMGWFRSFAAPGAKGSYGRWLVPDPPPGVSENSGKVILTGQGTDVFVRG